MSHDSLYVPGTVTILVAMDRESKLALSFLSFASQFSSVHIKAIIQSTALQHSKLRTSSYHKTYFGTPVCRKDNISLLIIFQNFRAVLWLVFETWKISRRSEFQLQWLSGRLAYESRVKKMLSASLLCLVCFGLLWYVTWCFTKVLALSSSQIVLVISHYWPIDCVIGGVF